MMNTALFEQMFATYSNMAFTPNYIMGFKFKGNIYFAHMDEAQVKAVMTLDKASRGAGYALRFKPNTGHKVYMLQFAKVLCSVEFFDDMVKNSKYNKGEIFEKLMTEHYGQTWVKDSVPFTQDGDLTVNGTAYQIKYESATFTNEKTLMNLTK